NSSTSGYCEHPAQRRQRGEREQVAHWEYAQKKERHPKMPLVATEGLSVFFTRFCDGGESAGPARPEPCRRSRDWQAPERTYRARRCPVQFRTRTSPT